MPLAQAQALAVLMLRNIRRYEQAAGIDIDLPRDVLEKLQIPPEDWQLFRDGL
jgi:hypothetical protein